MHRRRILTAGIALVTLAGTFGGSGASAADPEPAKHGRTITLITGDKVQLHAEPGGRTAVSLQPAAGRERIGFARSTDGDDIYVVPLDAHRSLTAGRLDPRLFNVTELERQGFADRGGAVPVIVSYAPGAAARTAAPARAASTTRNPESDTLLDLCRMAALSAPFADRTRVPEPGRYGPGKPRDRQC